MLSILTMLFKSLTIFSGSYSNNVFKSPLSKEEEDKHHIIQAIHRSPKHILRRIKLKKPQ